MSTLPSSESIAAEWLRDGRRVVGATLVERIGSAPLDPGAQMLVDDRNNIEGSVTGGCVEGALVEEAQRILRGGEARVVTYGVSDEEAAEVGLMCGGTVSVFVHEHRDDALEALEAVAGRARPTSRSLSRRCSTAIAPARRWRSCATAWSAASGSPGCSTARWSATRRASSTRGCRGSAATGPTAR